MAEWNWNEWRDRCHALACDNGWHDKPHTDGHLLMLAVTEIAEAVEAFRAPINTEFPFRPWAEQPAWRRCPYCGCQPRVMPDGSERFTCEQAIDNGKPCGVASELADVVIRLLDLAGLRAVDVSGCTPPDPHPMGSTPAFVASCWGLVRDTVLHEAAPHHMWVGWLCSLTVELANSHGVDLAAAIARKHAYNETRSWRHGGKSA